MDSSSGGSRILRLILVNENYSNALETPAVIILVSIKNIEVQRPNYVKAEKNESAVFI